MIYLQNITVTQNMLSQKMPFRFSLTELSPQFRFRDGETVRHCSIRDQMSALDRGSFFSRSDLSDPIRQPLIRREPVSRMRLLARTGLILASEFCERMAFYSIAANLFFFMTNQMDLDADVGNIFLLAFVGTCYVSPLLGGYLADSFLGRFQTIVLFDVAYVVGMALLAGGTFMGPKDVHWLIYISLFTIALGTGGIKANVIPFGTPF